MNLIDTTKVVAIGQACTKMGLRTDERAGKECIFHFGIGDPLRK